MSGNGRVEPSKWEGLNPPYSTIVADPPWRYNAAKTVLRGGGRGAGAEHHYDTMTNAEIAALPVVDLAADQSHLYLWTTNPRLIAERNGSRGITPFDIVEAWGFTPMTVLTWVKTSQDGAVSRGGTGWYFRGATEHVIFGVRGKLGVPSDLRVPNVILAPRRRHSAKPDEFFGVVERVSPAPRLELFARSPRLGWDVWGDESMASPAPPLTTSRVAHLLQLSAAGADHE